MSVSPFDSALLGRGFADAEVARLFSDGAELRAMLLVWGVLARAQGSAGLIPETAAAAIHRATREIAIDPGELAERTAQDGVPVPALLTAVRREMQAPEHARWIHHGATSQDIVDTGAALRLRRALDLIADRLETVLATLATLAEAHAETPMAARTWGQIATPTTFGATAAIWGDGLLAMRAELPAIRGAVAIVTLNGAAGTLSMMGAKGPTIREAVARDLDLSIPEGSPHTERSHIRALASWLDRTAQAAAKPATDLLLLARDGSVTLGIGGGSSTMPQKANPVAAARIRALAIHAHGLAATCMADHWDQRDGAAWFAEWLALPPLATATAQALSLLGALAVRPDPARLRAPLDDPSGLIHAEAVTFALDAPDAKARVSAWVDQVRQDGGSLIERSGLDPADFAPERQWGEAPALARRFAARVRDGA